jgi:hypothetical protein
MAILAFVISDTAALPDWIRVAVSPGWVLGSRLTEQQPCGAFLDCMGELAREVGQAAEIILAVNIVIYGLLIFGIANTISALKRKQSDTV